MRCFGCPVWMVDDVGGAAAIRCICVTNSRNLTQGDTHTDQERAGSRTDRAASGDLTLTAAGKMLLSLVLLSLLVSPALSLTCYACSSSTTNAQCNNGTQECPAPLDTCMTVIDTLGASTTIMKQCASWATCSGAASTASVDSNGNGNKVGCCNGYDLCNFSSGGMVRAHTTLLLLTVGVLLLRTH